MTKSEQQRFVSDLVNSIKGDVLAQIKLDMIPEEWDGHELRWLLALRFEQGKLGTGNDARMKRYRDFLNTVLVKNL